MKDLYKRGKITIGKKYATSFYYRCDVVWCLILFSSGPQGSQLSPLPPVLLRHGQAVKTSSRDWNLSGESLTALRAVSISFPMEEIEDDIIMFLQSN